MFYSTAGVIGNKEAHPVQTITAREFGGSKQIQSSTNDESDVKTAGGLFGVPIDRGEKDKAEPPLTPEPPISLVPMIPPTTDTSMIQG